MNIHSLSALNTFVFVFFSFFNSVWHLYIYTLCKYPKWESRAEGKRECVYIWKWNFNYRESFRQAFYRKSATPEVKYFLSAIAVINCCCEQFDKIVLWCIVWGRKTDGTKNKERRVESDRERGRKIPDEINKNQEKRTKSIGHEFGNTPVGSSLCRL